LLDEVGDLPERTQVALLRVLQEREVLAVGATRPVPIDVRLIAATHRDLRTLVAKGSFRADLYARLAGFQITLPALRDRREDLGMLVHALIARLAPCRELTVGIKAARAIFRHTWPLNVRELERCLASALVLASGDKLDFSHLPEDVKRASVGAPDLPKSTSAEPAMTIDRPPETLIESERRHVTLVLEYTGWQKRSAAEILGISRPTLDRKIRQLGLARSAPREGPWPDEVSNALARSSTSPRATKRRR
jgi:DNA-binding NtrC family response regulator